MISKESQVGDWKIPFTTGNSDIIGDALPQEAD